MKRRPKAETGGIDAIMRNCYRSPLEDQFIRRIPDFYQVAEFTISDLRIRQGIDGGEREFIAWLNAALWSTVEDMAAELIVPTLPVHDHNAPACTK